MTKTHIEIDLKKISILKRLKFPDLLKSFVIHISSLQSDVLLVSLFFLFAFIDPFFCSCLNTYKRNFVYLFFITIILEL